MYISTKNTTYKERLDEYNRNTVQKMLNSDRLNEHNREILKKYEEATKNRVNKISSVCLCVRVMYNFALHIKKDFNMVSKDDVLTYIADLRADNKKDSTLVVLVSNIKCFYKWYLGNNEYYPDFIKSIKVKAQLTPIKLEELLTEEDIVKMLKACGGNDIIAIEQRALLMTIVDSGARISEILNIKLKDIIVDSYGYTLGLDGKTGYRQIRLVKAVPYLKQWLNLRTGDENTPLFTNFEKNTGNGLSYCEVYRFMQSLKRKSGVKKAVNPHKLRHRRATEMSISGFNEKELNIQFGWTDNANTSKRYNHSNAATVGDKLLVQEGIPLREKKKTSGLKARICPSCGNNTLPHNDFCACGQILVIKKPDVKQITKDNVENALQGIVNDKELSKEFHTLLQKFVDKQN